MDVAACVEVETESEVQAGRMAARATESGRSGGSGSTAGVAVYTAAATECGMSNPMNEAEQGNFVVYFKSFPGLITPFNLPIECFPEYEKMLDEDPGAIETVNIMLRGPVAKSTTAAYRGVVNRFHGFCADRGYAFPNFSTGAVLRFAKDCLEEGAGLAFFQKLIPALDLLEQVLGTEVTALNKVVRNGVTAIKRELGEHRGIVKKATGYSYTVIRVLIEKEILPHTENVHLIEAQHFRSIFRAIIVYFTFCRFDDFSRLTDKHFVDGGNHVIVIFEKSKNDQFGDNSRSVIMERNGVLDCPVKMIRLFFKKFGLSFQGTGKSVNFRLQKEAGRHKPLWRTSLAQSNATKCTRQLLEKHGFQGDSFTEKSLKVQGVTDLLDTGEPLENVMVFGRWKQTTTPCHYRNLSANFLQGIAGRIPM